MEQAFDRLSALDCFFVDSEQEDSPMHIGAVCLFEDPQTGDRRVTLRRLRAHVEARLSLIPRYRQRLMRVPVERHPVWVDCADFRIGDHVRGVALSSPSSPGHLEETASWILSQPLSRNRPLWEIWLVEGLPSGGFALVCKTHHCLADGLGGAALLCAILGAEPFSIPETPRAWRPRPVPSTTELLRGAVDARIRGAVSLATEAASNAIFSPRSVITGAAEVFSAVRSLADASLRPAARTAFDAPTGTDRRFLWWSVALDDVKRISRRLGGTVNDVALTLVSEAFAQMGVQNQGAGDLRVYCPVGVGPMEEASTHKIGNQVAGMLVDLPVDAPDLKTRWDRVVCAAREGKASGAIKGAFLLENIANTLTPSLLSRLEALTGGSQLFNLILTNVPGPQVPLYLFEQQMTGVCPLVPLFRGQGLGIAIFSYAGKLTWGFHVDASRIDAARKLRSALATAVLKLARLADAAVVTAAHELSAAQELISAQEMPADQEISSAQEMPLPIPLHPARLDRERIASAG